MRADVVRSGVSGPTAESSPAQSGHAVRPSQHVFGDGLVVQESGFSRS